MINACNGSALYSVYGITLIILKILGLIVIYNFSFKIYSQENTKILLI